MDETEKSEEDLDKVLQDVERKRSQRKMMKRDSQSSKKIEFVKVSSFK